MQYRLLTCSDTHGEVPPLVDETGITAWLNAGDVCNGPELPSPRDKIDPHTDFFLARVTKWFDRRSVPVYAVDGNHDLFDVYDIGRLAEQISGRVVSISPRLFVAGIGWHGERYFELPMESDLVPICDAVVRQALRQVMPSDSLILLTHYPPRFPGLYDVPNDVENGGVWYNCVRRVVEELRPIAIVQGHNHKWFGTTRSVRLGSVECLIANPGPTGCEILIDVEQRIATYSDMRHRTRL